MRYRLAELLVVLCPLQAYAASTIFIDASASPGGKGGSWSDAFVSLSEALAASKSGDQIWVAEGTYAPACPIECTFSIPSGVHLLGGFGGADLTMEARNPVLHVAMLSGDFLADDVGFGNVEDDALHVVTIENAIDIVIDGFSLRSCNFLGADQWGGLIRLGASEVSLRNCRVYEGLTGAAIYATDSVIEVDSCMFNDSFADQIKIEDGFLSLSYASFSRNFGSVFALGECVIDIVDCDFKDGTGAISFSGPVSGRVRSCAFLRNSGPVIANHVQSGNPLGGGPTVHIMDSVFAANSADGDNAVSVIDNQSCHPLIERCTIVGNVVPAGGTAIYNWGGAIPTIRSSIIWGNTAGGTATEDAQVLNSSGAVFISNCNIEGLTGKLLEIDCISEDPKFVDLDGSDGILGTEDDDYRLSSDSPCVDAGSVSDTVLGTDLLGWPRLTDGDLDGAQRVDMGASEFCHIGLDMSVRQDAVGQNTYLSLVVSGPRSMQGQLLVGYAPGIVGLAPFGALLFDPGGGWMRYALGSLPAVLVVNVTPLVGMVGPVTLQVLGLAGGGVGNLSNAVVLDLHP